MVQLTCSASFTDFNDGSLSTSYTWTNGSTTIGTGTSYTIDASDVSPTDTIYCESSATDNNGSTANSVASIVVNNTNPSVDSVTISPTTLYVDSTITCAYTASDIDSGESQSVVYNWSRNGSPEGGNSSTYNGSLNVGDTLTCTVSVTDNFGGTANGSTTVSIDNRAPNIVSITLPSNVNSQSDITAVVLATDQDNQTLSYTYAWFKQDVSNGNNVVAIGTSSVITSASQFDKHDTVYVTVNCFRWH